MSTTTTTTTTITAYAENIDTQSVQFDQFSVFDTATGRQIGLVTRITGGFLSYIGQRGTAHEGVEAIIRPFHPYNPDTVEEALRAGIRSGRDDRN